MGKGVIKYKLLVTKLMNHGDIMYSMVTILKKTVLCI